jgi:MYXO-CTERM domain-containing protein
VTWQALPFPNDSDWGGAVGSPAIITPTEIILSGQPVRSVQSFSGPLMLQFDVSLDARSTTDGAFELFFIPLGIPLDKSPIPATSFLMGYRNRLQPSQDALYLQQVTNTVVWGPIPFVLAVSNVYHYVMNIAANGAIDFSINGLPFLPPSAAAAAYSPFQIELEGWQPGNVWHVQNFTAVPTIIPEPGTATLVGLSVMGLLALIRRRR